jgi:hypothetical protein
MHRYLAPEDLLHGGLDAVGDADEMHDRRVSNLWRKDRNLGGFRAGGMELRSLRIDHGGEA